MIEPYAIAPSERPPLKIWERPVPDYQYVMGIDTGEGLGLEDSVCDMYCKQSGAQVAQYVTNQQDPEEFGMTCILIGIYYNDALAVIESNDAGLTVIVIFKQIDGKTGFSRYKRSRIWKKRNLLKAKQVARVDFGWQTNRGNRRHLIFDYKAGIKRGYLKIRDVETLNQMKSFVRKKEGKIEHADGEKDDRIFAGALAWQGFKDIAPREIEEAKKKEGPTTIGEFIAVCRGIDKGRQRTELIIGRDEYEEETSIIIRR